MMTKDKYHHGSLREELISKGLQLLNKEGYEGFSLRKVAILCEVSHAAPYKHFKSKEELIAAIIQEVVESFRASLEKAVAEYADDPVTQIVEMGKQYIKYMVENPDYLRFLFLNSASDPILIKEDKFWCSEGGPFNIFEKSATKFLAAVNSPKENRVADILALWSLVHGFSVLVAHRSIELQDDYLDMAEKVIRDRLRHFGE